MRSNSIARRVAFNHPPQPLAVCGRPGSLVRASGSGGWQLDRRAFCRGEPACGGGRFFLINELMCFVVEIREPKIDRGLVENALLGISCVTGMAQRWGNSSRVRHRPNRHVRADWATLVGAEAHLSGK